MAKYQVSTQYGLVGRVNYGTKYVVIEAENLEEANRIVETDNFNDFLCEKELEDIDYDIEDWTESEQRIMEVNLKTEVDFSVEDNA